MKTNNLCEKIDVCPVPKFYRVIGKKWCYPILCSFMSGESYSFEDIVGITHRNVPRSSLSIFLKELVQLKIIAKKDNGKYCLTEKGKMVKSKFEDIKKIMTSKCDLLDE